jgi:hypothetical protein
MLRCVAEGTAVNRRRGVSGTRRGKGKYAE